MDLARQILEILRDMGIVIGIPTLIVLWLRVIRARIDVLNEKIDFLKKTQYPNALLMIESQKKLYEIELQQLSMELKKFEQASAHDIGGKKEIEEDIQAVKESLNSLEGLRKDISGGIESEAIRKFELFCKDLTDPNESRPDYIFGSVTYGDGIAQVEVSALERRGVIEVRDGNVRLTEKGKEIWQTLQKLEKRQK